MTVVRERKPAIDSQPETFGWNGSALRLPADVGTLAGFRAWAQSDDFPEKGKFSLINGNILINMSPEEIETHNKVNTAISHGLTGMNDEAGPGGQVYALQSQTGGESWRTTSATPPTYGLLAPGMLYIGSASGSADALTLRDGARLWHHALIGEIHSPPVLAGDTLYIGASSGILYAFDGHSGALRWQYPAQ